jgi:hypothetical protein
MANPTVRIHDLETGEIVDREMTNDEYAAWQAEQAEWVANNPPAE